MAIWTQRSGRASRVGAQDRPRPPAALVLGMLGLALLLAFAASVQFGATGIGLEALPRLLASLWFQSDGGTSLQVDRLVLFDIRLPRAVLGALVGAALGASGAVMQGLFRNPLADPGMIGVSAGAALAAVATIVLGDGVLAFVVAPLGRWAVPLAGLAGGFGMTALLYAFATRAGMTSVTTILLGGVALGALAGAFTGMLVFIANDRQLRDLTFWSLGSLSGASWPKIGVLLPFLALGAACLPALTPVLNAFLLGETEAFLMGGRVERTKRLAMLAVGSAVGASVSLTGAIGFIGLLVPHLVRLVCGPDHRIVLPGSALLGGTLLLLSDTAARTLAAPAELPVGIVTAAVGAPCFLWLLLRRRHEAP
ncbi:MAG TPA: iron ABC transporter permease [Aliidongia sp.]|nr:iron ABC transporter permease [Aliidongia sp.]